jgi:hypothetical protein
MNENVAKLAHAIIEEFNSDNQFDILPRWMAFHLAKLMNQAEATEGEEKVEIEAKCEALILEIWKYKVCLPGSNNPLALCEKLFGVLESLDPDTKSFIFLRNFDDPKSYNFTQFPQTVQQWIDFIVAVDRTARIWIDYARQRVFEDLTDDKTRELLTLNQIIDDIDPDTNYINLVTKYISKSDHDQPIKLLEGRISQLDHFVHCSNTIKKALEKEIDQLIETS